MGIFRKLINVISYPAQLDEKSSILWCYFGSGKWSARDPFSDVVRYAHAQRGRISGNEQVVVDRHAHVYPYRF